MVPCKGDIHVRFRLSADDLADLLERLAGHDHFLRRVGVFQLDLADRDPVPVKGNDLQDIVVDLKELSCHHFIRIAVRDGEDRLADHFFQRKFGDRDKVILLYGRKIGEIISRLGRDIELRLFTCDKSLALTLGLDHDLAVRELSYDFRKDPRVQGDDPPLYDLTVNGSFDPELHVVRSQFDDIHGSIDQDALQYGHRRF